MKKYKIVSDISNLNRDLLAESIKDIIKDGWGDFGIDYVKKHILTSEYLTIAIDKKNNDKIVGFASVREMKYKNEIIYYLEFTAVRGKHQGNNLAMRLNKKVMHILIVANIRKLKEKFIVMAISPNPRVLGTMTRTADKIYPDFRQAQKAPDDIWEKVQRLVKFINDPFTKLERNQSVIEGFYDDKPELIYDPKRVPRDKSVEINNFASKHLKYEKRSGREFVIYAEYSLWGLLRHEIERLFDGNNREVYK